VRPLDTTARVLDRALAARAFSAVTAEVGAVGGAIWRYAAGRLSYESDRRVTSATIFDLASLTKVLCTTALSLRLLERGILDLATPIAALMPTWAGDDRCTVRVRDLLEHSTGLPAYQPYYLTLSGRASYELAIGHEPLAYPPRSKSIYSDLDFMLLGFIIEDLFAQPLERAFLDWRTATGLQGVLRFVPDVSVHDDIAATELDPWRGRLLQGQVHDENAAALDGIAGHAGLFGTAEAVGEAARWWLARLAGHDDPGTGISAATAREAVRRSQVPGSSRALGWDTMLPTSSCGTRWSPSAIGHTGFTGTSLWLDPERDRYAVLLTNRVHPSRENDRIQRVRRDFHDAIALDLERAA
jgi:CubicO group peptidase (beta-lactamase class C family)